MLVRVVPKRPRWMILCNLKPKQVTVVAEGFSDRGTANFRAGNKLAFWVDADKYIVRIKSPSDVGGRRNMQSMSVQVRRVQSMKLVHVIRAIVVERW